MEKRFARRHLRRRVNTTKHKAKMKRYSEDLHFYPGAVYWNGRYLKRIYRSGHSNSSAHHVRRSCNKAVRCYVGEVGNHSFYRRIADYWWTLY